MHAPFFIPSDHNQQFVLSLNKISIMFIHKMNLIVQNETAKYMTLFGKVHSLRSIQSFLNGFGNYPKTQKVTNNKPNL